MVAGPFEAERPEKLGEAEASKGPEGHGVQMEAEELVQPVLEAYGDGNVGEIGVDMDYLAAEVAGSDIGGYHRPVSGLAALVAMEMAKGPAWSDVDAALAGHRDSGSGRDCEGDSEDLDADIDAGGDYLGKDGLGDEEYKEDVEDDCGDDEEEEEDRSCGSAAAVAGTWLWEVLTPYHFAVGLLGGVGSNALGRAAPVVLVPSKDVRFVGSESHQLDIVNQTAGAGAEVDAQVEAEVGVQVGVDAEVEAEVDAEVGAEIDAGIEVEAEVDVEAEVQVEVEVEVEIGFAVGVEVDAERVEFEADAEVDVEVEIEVEGAEAGFGNSLRVELADE
ncbi:hypothetical protein Trihar35433_3001 [Trichoderma harzianum]|nr:hypothetical protein Trihar35433_3001 [Trichoderma harzianum]